MNQLIDLCLSKRRAVLFLFLFILIAGWISYVSIPKESTPDIQIPYININVIHEGISAEDAEALLLKPLEENLKNISGIKEMWSHAHEGSADITLEFQAGTDINRALQDTRVNVDKAKSKFPKESEDPTVEEINLSLFPVLIVKLSGDVSDRTLYKIADELKDAIKSRVTSVLSAETMGKGEDVVEILIDPEKIENYGLLNPEVLSFFERNNTLISAGTLTTGSGDFSIKIPGLFKTVLDIFKTPLISDGVSSVTVGDVAEVRKTYKDPTSIARDRGISTVTIEIKKRTGQNIIETIENVQKVVDQERLSWPSGVHVSYSQDNSIHIRDMLKDLRNEITSALILVMIVILASLGLRSAILVGLAVPGSFLMAILVLSTLGYTLNTVVLFSLILSIGMLVDGAIVVVEHANRKMFEGLSREAAYKEGAQRMAWPVISSTVTIILAFLPLLFWPGIVGQFMKFLPITLIATLTASILMALIFVPSLGTLFGGIPKNISPALTLEADIVEHGSQKDLKALSGLNGRYVRFLDRCLVHPLRPLLVGISILVGVIFAYGFLGKGVEFFPDVEPDNAMVLVHARGNLSIYEMDKLVHQVENEIIPMTELKSIYTNVGKESGNVAEDVIGKITLEFIDWKERRKVDEILKEIGEKTKGIPGIIVETQKEQGGPTQGKPIVIEVSSRNPEDLLPAFSEVKRMLDETKGLTGIEDDRPIPGIEWELSVDRIEAAKFDADIKTVGHAIQLVTQGLKFGTYRPNDAQDEVDIVARLPVRERTLERLKMLHITTPKGQIPLSNFVVQTPKQRINSIHRVMAKRTYTLRADVLPDVLLPAKVAELKEEVAQMKFSNGVEVTFKGEDKDQQETQAFLVTAFGTALFLIALILVIQFNSFFSMSLVLSSIVMSTIGVFVGLIVTQQPFGIVMGGIGIIALSGIIVSNNIIFIDTFDHLRRGLKKNHTLSDVRDIILRTGAQRLRPVILTKLTIVLGLLPIMCRMNVDYMNRSIHIGAPSSGWWTLLATTIVFGVLFASPLTLILTPSLLMLREKMRFWKEMKKNQRNPR